MEEKGILLQYLPTGSSSYRTLVTFHLPVELTKTFFHTPFKSQLIIDFYEGIFTAWNDDGSVRIGFYVLSHSTLHTSTARILCVHLTPTEYGVRSGCARVWIMNTVQYSEHLLCTSSTPVLLVVLYYCRFLGCCNTCYNLVLVPR